MKQTFRTGIDAIDAITQLLQRIRKAHPDSGGYQAAELQFWWSRPRRTDTVQQLFWFDDTGQPEAAVILVDFADASSLLYRAVTFCPVLMPDATADQVAYVVTQGLAHAAEQGFTSVELEVGTTDAVMHQVLAELGFVVKEEAALVECWLDVARKPAISPLADGYRLRSRADMGNVTHHMSRAGDDFAERLQQLSLYRTDLDLVVLTDDNEQAGMGLFWYDPTTTSGVVEPMGTLDEHRQKGLARHILTAGIDKLANLGATRIAINYEPDNPASGRLYRSVGFEPARQNGLFSGATS